MIGRIKFDAPIDATPGVANGELYITILFDGLKPAEENPFVIY